jgi:hypothetical protein
MNMSITAYDLYNMPFDLDQYRLMKFHIEIEITQQREKGLLTEQDVNDNCLFLAKG